MQQARRKRGEAEQHPDHYRAMLPAMAVGWIDRRMDGWMDRWMDEWMGGYAVRGNGLPKGWLYYARWFSARPGMKRRKIAPAVTISR